MPTVDAAVAKRTFAALHQAISAGLVRACHDLSEGGLAAAIAEMAFAGGFGAAVELSKAPHSLEPQATLETILLFSESNTRFLCEVLPEAAQAFEQQLKGVPHARVGSVIDQPRLEITSQGRKLIDADLKSLKTAWQAPLDWP